MEWHNRAIKATLAATVRHYGGRYLHGRLLDVGCGVKPYKSTLRPFVNEHIGVDHAAATHGIAHVDIVASAYDIPLPDMSFDSALATEVLEHLENPIVALKEWRRLLRPSGVLLVTTPFMWHLHEEPRDFYRYTPFGLRFIVEEAGFEIIEVRTLGGFWSTFGQFIAYVLLTYETRTTRRLGIGRFLGGLSQRLGRALERRSPRPRWGSHVVAVARRPSDEHSSIEAGA